MGCVVCFSQSNFQSKKPTALSGGRLAFGVGRSFLKNPYGSYLQNNSRSVCLTFHNVFLPLVASSITFV